MIKKELLQNSPEWFEWRLGGIGASEVSAILGVCPYNTRYDVWLVKTQRQKGFDVNSFFTVHGQETEAKARARYEMLAMTDMNPSCGTHPKYSICTASLDGVSNDGKLILELKCPKSTKTLEAAKAGHVPDHYYPQIQYQLAVTGADEADFFVYHEESGDHALVKVKPDIAYQGKIIAEVLKFWEQHILTDSPPELTERDVKVIENDRELAKLCEMIIAAKEAPTTTKKQMDIWKAMAVQMAGHPKMRCGDVQISTVNRDGKFSFYKLNISRKSA